MRNINSKEKRRLRAELCRKADGKCEYCRTSIGMAGTVDHRMPQAKGGTNARSNLRWCCRFCNKVKGAMTPTEWEEFIPLMKLQARMPERDRMDLLNTIARRAQEAA